MGWGARTARKFRKYESCLPFTWANLSVHGLGKWYAKFRTGKFCPEGLNTVSKMALKKWNTNFRLEYPFRKNRNTFSDVPFSRTVSDGTTQKVVFHSLSNRIFLTIVVNGKQPNTALLFQGTRGTTNQKHYPDLGSDASSVWNFSARFLDVKLVFF